MDRTALPKGHIMGWVAPSSENQSKKTSTMSKSSKKNEKRREKKREEKERIIKDSWEDEDEDTLATSPSHVTPPDVDKSEKTGADALANTMASLSMDK
jgi:partner of Y14 and mago protein